MKNNLILFLGLSLLLSCSSKKTETNDSRVTYLPYYEEATFTPHWMEPNDKALDDFHKVSPFEFSNQEGQTISEETFANKIYVTNFFFTICPGICPQMMDNMLILQDEYLEDEEVLLLSHSVTPNIDSVSVLKKYATAKGISAKTWHLVTGKQEEIYKLGRKDYFIEEDLGEEKEEDEFLHTENFVLIDKNRHIRGIYNGLNRTALRQLMTDIKTLKTEG